MGVVGTIGGLFCFCFLINCKSFFNIILMYFIYYFNVLNGKKKKNM